MSHNASKATFLVLTAAALIALPIFSLLYVGPFAWHVRQPEAWQGGSEVLLVAAAIYFSLKHLSGRPRWLIVTVVVWVYARHQGVDFAIIILFLYVESIFALGNHTLVFLKRGKSNQYDHFVKSAIAGVSAWSLCIWVLSLLNFGSAQDLRWLAISILGIALATDRSPRLIDSLRRGVDSTGRNGAAFHALTIAFAAALFAKTAVSIDYDSTWYGLIGNHVLAGGGSLFDSEGLVAPVHYYPKLYEALLLPLSGIGSVTAILGFGIVSWLIALVVLKAILNELRIPRKWQPASICLFATIPAFANIATTAKGDVFAASFILMAIYAVLRLKNTIDAGWLWFGGGAVLIGAQSRLSSLPYAFAVTSLLIACTANLVVRQRRSGGGLGFAELWNSRALVFFIATASLTILVTLRTFLLAGVPLIAPNGLVSIAGDLGLSLKFPAGILPTQKLHALPFISSIVSYLVNPSRYAHVQIDWTGNFWIFLPLVALCYKSRSIRSLGNLLIFLSVGSIFFFIILLVPFDSIGGGDGNYFIIPIISLGVSGVILLRGIGRNSGVPLQVLMAVLFSFALSSAAISFVTGSWGPGTRAFDWKMDRSPLDYTRRQQATLKHVYLEGISNFLPSSNLATRVVGVAPAPDAWWLPARYEPIDVISWSNPKLVASSAAMQDFLTKDKIEYVILRSRQAAESFKTTSPGFLPNAVAALSASGAATLVYSDRHYDLWKLSPRQAVDQVVSPDGSVLIVSPVGNPTCDDTWPFVANVGWTVNAIDATHVNIYVIAPDQSEEHLWASAGVKGSQATGAWVRPGSRFLVRNSLDQHLLLSKTVMPQCDHP